MSEETAQATIEPKFDWPVLPTLAETIEATDADRYIADDSYSAEQKVNGVRCSIHIDDKVAALNRKGGYQLLPVEIGEAFQWVKGPFVFDGELIKKELFIFDMPVALEVVGPRTPQRVRRELLEGLWPKLEMPACVKLLPAANTAEEKQQLVDRVREIRGEGVMFKDRNGLYVPGKRTKNQLKFKFIKDIDCIVIDLGLEGKQNFSVGLVREETGEIIEVATVSALTGDGAKVDRGDVVTVHFLYASEDGRLVQPTRPILRTDKTPHECVLSQLDPFLVNKLVLDA